jgi:hypothetical protein
VSFWKQHFLQLRYFKVEIGSVSSKLACSAELKKHMFHLKDNHLCKKQKHVEQCFPVRTELGLRVLLPEIQAFKMEKGSCFSKMAYLSEGKKHLYLSKENNICWKLHQLPHCFPVKIE